MRAYTNEFTNEKMLLNAADVWYRADECRLLGLKNCTICMHYVAWRKASNSFIKACMQRGIEIIVVR